MLLVPAEETKDTVKMLMVPAEETKDTVKMLMERLKLTKSGAPTIERNSSKLVLGIGLSIRILTLSPVLALGAPVVLLGLEVKHI